MLAGADRHSDTSLNDLNPLSSLETHIQVHKCVHIRTDGHMHNHTRRYMHLMHNIPSILLHGLLVVQTCVVAYVPMVYCEVH